MLSCSSGEWLGLETWVGTCLQEKTYSSKPEVLEPLRLTVASVSGESVQVTLC